MITSMELVPENQVFANGLPHSDGEGAGQEAMRVAVIGAGPAGLTCAYELSRRGVMVEVFEASSSVGGMSRSIQLWGQTADLGPHRFFSNDRRVNQVWIEVAKRDYSMINRLTRILYRGRLFHYPLKPINALSNLGLFEAARCVTSCLWTKLIGSPGEDSFEGWVAKRFGKRLFEIFFKTYSEKLWGITCRELDSAFAAQRIKRFSLFEAIKSAILPRSRKHHKTLVDRFAYPLGGTGEIYEKMKRVVEERRGKVHLKTPVERVRLSNGRAIGITLADGREMDFDHVVSSMPLTLLVKGIGSVPADVTAHLDKLEYRNTVLVYLRIAGEKLFPDNWLYVHSDNLKTGRITNFRNWAPSLFGSSGDSILSLEYWCNDGDSMWGWDDVCFDAQAREDIARSGLLGQAAVVDSHVLRLHRSYPVYRCGYRHHLGVVENYLRSVSHLHVIGRYGAFKYNNQDHSILMGILAAENVACRAQHDLWSVNTDYDSYQEAAVIDETGLVQRGKQG